MERQTSNKNDFWLIAVILLIAAAITGFFLLIRDTNGAIAALSIDGTIVEVYDLAEAENQHIDLQETYDVPVILEIRDGAIRFWESVCPDHLCENYGFISQVAETAVCMPNRTVVTIYSPQDNIFPKS